MKLNDVTHFHDRPQGILNGLSWLLPSLLTSASFLVLSLFTLGNFRSLVNTELKGAKAVQQLIAAPAAGAVLIELLVSMVLLGLLVVACLWSALWIKFRFETWRKQIVQKWVQVKDCAWLTSLKSFWACLKGLFWTLVETVEFVAVTAFCLLMLVVNYVGAILIVLWLLTLVL